MPADTGASVPTSQALMPTVTLHVEPRVAGAPVRFRVVVHNAGTERVTLYLRGRTPVVDVIVERDGARVWQRLADEVIPAIIQARTFEPGERMTLDAEWRAPTAPGEYEAHALLLTDEPSPRRSNTVRFAIQ